LSRTGSGILSVFFKYLKYRCRSGHKKGRGIHSPFVFELTSKVIYNKDGVKVIRNIPEFHKRMLSSRQGLNIVDHGAGSRVTSDTTRKISSIASASSITKKYGEVLYRLSSWYAPETMMELGTGIGISTAYLSAGCPEALFYTAEGSVEKIEFAKAQLKESGLGHIHFIHSTFEDCLSDILQKMKSHCLIFIDGDHRYEPTVNAVRQILENDILEEVVIVLDDIHWSHEMERAWKELCEDQRIDISVNLFFMGFLIRRPGIEKQHFNITL
jgi:predicted O-methyltransferase YrrM